MSEQRKKVRVFNLSILGDEYEMCVPVKAKGGYRYVHIHVNRGEKTYKAVGFCEGDCRPEDIALPKSALVAAKEHVEFVLFDHGILPAARKRRPPPPKYLR